MALADDHHRGFNCVCSTRACDSQRYTKSKESVVGSSLVRRAEGPARWVFPLLALTLALSALPVRSNIVGGLRHVVGLGVIATVAW
jgi:hypothetical protein